MAVGGQVHCWERGARVGILGSALTWKALEPITEQLAAPASRVLTLQIADRGRVEESMGTECAALTLGMVGQPHFQKKPERKGIGVF